MPYTPEELGGLRDYLAKACASDSAAASSPDDELCAQGEETTKVTCSNGKRIFSAIDRCHEGGDAAGKAHALAQELEARVHVDAWIGAPAERQACEAGANGRES